MRETAGIWQNELLINKAMNITTFWEDARGGAVIDNTSGTLYQIFAIVKLCAFLDNCARHHY